MHSNYVYKAYIKNYYGQLKEIGNYRYKGLPYGLQLFNGYPNPFNSIVNINFVISEVDEGNVTVEIFNTLGQRVKILYNNYTVAGKYELNWDATNQQGAIVGSGVYYCRLSSPMSSLTKRLVVLK